MKKFSLFVTLIVAIFFCGNASAASWVVMSSDDTIEISIDKDSIRRGTDSKKFPKFNRKDGYSAITKLDVKISDSEKIDMVYLISFYEKDGERMFCLLDGYDGSDDPSDIIQEKVDLEGRVWPKVWSYIEENLK